MGLGDLLFGTKRGDCQIHDGHRKKANRTLLIMVAACLGLIVWHVWAYGPSGAVAARPDSASTPSFRAKA